MSEGENARPEAGGDAVILSRDALGVRRSADAAVAAARREAEEILAAARAEADAVKARAEAEGAANGKRAAARIAAEASAAARAELAALESDLAATVAACVRRVIAWVPEEERLAALCRAALADLAEERALKLVVAPEARARAATALARECADGVITLGESDALGPDQALLETATGVIDLSLDAQLDALAEALGAPRVALGLGVGA